MSHLPNTAAQLTTQTVIPFDLFYLVKEAQVQHGLRTADFGRYHRYITTRVATLRKQLLMNKGTYHQKKKPYVHKQVTPEMLLQSTGINSRPSKKSAAAAALAAEDGSTTTVVPSSNDIDPSLVAAFSFSSLSSPISLSSGSSLGGQGGGRYLELLVLYAERCWAEYENILMKRATLSNASGRAGEKDNSSGGMRSVVTARKRLNKASKWTAKLVEVVTEVVKIAEETFSCTANSRIPQQQQVLSQLSHLGVQYVVASCEGYHLEMMARRAGCHGMAEEAKQHYLASRDKVMAAASHLASMTAVSSSSSATGVVSHTALISQVEPCFQVTVSKLAELDDRILFTMQQLGESLAAFVPASAPRLKLLAASETNADSTTSSAKVSYLTDHSTVRWLKNCCKKLNVSGGNNDEYIGDDEIMVYSLKVKEALREAAASNNTNAIQALMTSISPSSSYTGTPPLINVGTQVKIQDGFDKCAGALNDAIAHARQEQRGTQGEIRRKQGQLLLLYLQYHVGRTTADRTLFLIEVYMRRYLHMKQTMKKKLSLSTSTKIPSASPFELVRLYGTAIETLEELLLIPGVDGGLYQKNADEEGVVSDIIELQIAQCKAGKLFMAAEAWVVTRNYPLAMPAMQETQRAFANSRELSAKCSVTTATVTVSCPFETLTISHSSSQFLKLSCSTGERMGATIEVAALSLVAEMNLISYRTSRKQEAEKTKKSIESGIGKEEEKVVYLVDNLNTFTSAVKTGPTDSISNIRNKKEGPTGNARIIPFPPNYISVPCKPVFVDLSSTFVSYPSIASIDSNLNCDNKNTTKQQPGKQEPTVEANQQKRGWLGGWGWKK